MLQQDSQQQEEETVKEKCMKLFECSSCGNIFKYEYFSKHKDEEANLFMLEDTYYMRDPFVGKSILPLVLGGVCSFCGCIVCVSQSCSMFYTKRFCSSCIQKNLTSFPEEIQREYNAAKKLKE